MPISRADALITHEDDPHFTPSDCALDWRVERATTPAGQALGKRGGAPEPASDLQPRYALRS